MGTKSAALLLAACLLLTACGAESGTRNASSSSPEPEKEQSTLTSTDQEKEINVDLEQNAPADHSSTKTTESEHDPDEPPEDQTTPDAETVSTEPQYHMTSAYRIVPNDDSVPADVVLLTFDDGPKDEEMINRMIDILDKHNAKAIFFVNGYRVKSNPGLLQLIHERGQIVGNHSWDHIDLKKESKETVQQQIKDVQDIVFETIGEKPKFFRPPFGSGGDAVKDVARENDMLYMTWSNGSLDWDSKFKNKPDAIIQNVLDQLHPGSNILMHELPWTVEALDDLLTKLEDKGYSFVNPELIEPQMK